MIKSGMEETTRPEARVSEMCPRCSSYDTKFCYYNNYSLAQPRHFCKSCHRYWTLGGSLRDVPFGGSTRTLHHNKHPHKSTPLPPSTKRRRVSPASRPSFLPSTAPKSSPLDSPSMAPISSAAAPEAEFTGSVEPASVDVIADLLAMLVEPPPNGGFLGLSDRFLPEHTAEYELGLGTIRSNVKWDGEEALGIGKPPPEWPCFLECDSDGLAGVIDGGDRATSGENQRTC